MGSSRGGTILLHGLEILYAAAVLAFYALPYLESKPWIPPWGPDWVTGGLVSFLRMPAEVPGHAAGRAAALAVGFFAYLLPCIHLSKLAAPFLAPKRPGLFAAGRIFPLTLDISSSAFALVLFALHLLWHAGSARYFKGLSPVVYGMAGFSLAFNVFSDAMLVRAVSGRNATWLQYREFAKKSMGRKGGIFTLIVKAGIRERLVLSFIGITISVIAVLSYTLLTDFSKTMLETLTFNGKSLAERTASVVRANFADDIALGDYFSIERKRNLESELPFSSLSYYQKQGKSERFVVQRSTDPELLGAELGGERAAIEQTGVFFDRTARAYEFVSPIRLGSESKLVGFSEVVYDRDVIYEPYFRTQVKVALFSAAFVYIAVLLVYLLGGNIVLPILYLRMSVNRISSAISDMVAGRVKVSPALLDYQDIVKTRDEIKTLSTEIGHMAKVIRGVVPYISASTLRHADRISLLSEKRELAFLFTDIRGFTSLCEGRTPEEVVSIINRYLDLQSTIILDNGGDIDKFVGDAIMAMFEGEGKELRACKAAMEIRKAMAETAEERRAREQKTVSIGIGINTGEVVFGSVGAKDRMDFTSIGDTVNLAARLEGANKEYATKTLVSEFVRDKVSGHYLCREIDYLTVKGKSTPVRVYEILQEERIASKKVIELKRRFESGLARYRKRRWEDAKNAFRPLMEEFGDPTSGVFLDRIAYFERNPPPRGWNGVFDLTVK